MTPPPFNATVVIGTYGSDGWIKLAKERAVPSALALGLPIVHIHLPDGTLAEARNAALGQVATEWALVLDADDELEGGFGVYAAEAAAVNPDADVLVPQVRYIHPDGAPGVAHWPRVAGHNHECETDCLAAGNWIVVGAPVRTELARQVRWEEWSWSEDWAWWVSCWQAGAVFARAEGAVYRAHVRADSRNQRGTSGLDVHRQIATAYGLPVP